MSLGIRTTKPDHTEPIFAFLDGKTDTIDGMTGTFRYDIRHGIYPYDHYNHSLIFTADRSGRNTEAYQDIRSKLGDDWLMDLTDNIEQYVEIAFRLGYRVEMLKEV